MSSSAPAIVSPAVIHSNRSSLATMSPVGDLGYNFSLSSTRQSRHDHHRTSVEMPPSYLESDPAPPPEYTQKDEPVTLAMYLFKFGFLFPPFWIMGAFILFSPLHEPSSSPSDAWLPDKTDAEKEMIISRLRKAEVKWARRSLVAIVLLLVVGVGVGLAVWAVTKD
ncbi:uncharacterized protein EV420DRAFT_1296849 [Desarmillaria tabescens]|uniref:Transmembrane protein n=1 Tax=Armillaria tabescens TaxID=1929756 RepID=A0AA39NNV0_ARMTA|nr:uncharacterized protein EV420DRAFT_1296849 [Desarmillaria tabescens]KAK0468995.1 hypothetical protein EV420DRAFT_1296849 [Desarmillaria tabescens]